MDISITPICFTIYGIGFIVFALIGASRNENVGFIDGDEIFDRGLTGLLAGIIWPIVLVVIVLLAIVYGLGKIGNKLSGSETDED